MAVKRSIFISVLIGVLSSLSFLVSAQVINKTSLLKDLNNTDGMSLSPKQKKQYEDINNSTANSLLDLDKKKLSKNDRDKEVDRIFDKRDKDVEGIFGIDSKIEDTRKAYRKQTRGVKT